MASVEASLLINFILNGIIFTVGIIVALLIPSNRKIREGEAGTSLGAPWIILVLILMLIMTIALFPVSFLFQKGANLVLALVLDLIALIITSTAVISYLGARRAYRELREEGYEHVEMVRAVPTYGGHALSHPSEHLHPADPPPGNLITVECPQCGSHLHIPENSHTITCPYCGLTGSI